MRTSSKILGVAIVLIAILNCVIWFAVASADAEVLTVSFLNIGQGDAVFIETPDGKQILIDGGPSSSVLRELSKVMPWYDRSIDMVVATHPDLDHIGGLFDVLSRYGVGAVLESSVEGEAPAWRTFQAQIDGAAKSGTKKLEASRGQIFDLGSGVRLEILFPDRSLPGVATNVGCVVSRLVYGDTAFMLPCDSTSAVEEYLAELDGSKLKSNVLKAAHHGSKTSSSPIFVGFVDPQYGVFSRGCDNTYGHPHAQTVETFRKFDIEIHDTCKEGSISFVSDGKTVTVQTEK